jgi:hypothetical protein
VWNYYAPKTALRGPSPEASKQLIAMPIDLHSGSRLDGSNRVYSSHDIYGERPFYSEQRTANAGRFTEYLRLDANGRMVDSQHRVISREGSYPVSHGGWSDDRSPLEQFFGIFRQDRPYYVAPRDPRDDPRFRESYQDPRYRQDPRYQDPRSQDPRYHDPRYREDPRYRGDPRYGAPPGYIAPNWGGPRGQPGPAPDYSTDRRLQQHRVY